MARYGQGFKDRAVARLLPPESAAVEVVALAVGMGAETLQRWREQAQSGADSDVDSGVASEGGDRDGPDGGSESERLVSRARCVPGVAGEMES